MNNTNYYELKIYDVQGHLVKRIDINNIKEKVREDIITINDVYLAQGIYFVHLVSASDILIEKIEVIR